MHAKTVAFHQILFLLLFATNFVTGWVAKGYFFNKDHPGKCTVADNIIISPGEEIKSPTDCANIICLNGDGLADIHGCGDVAAPPGYEFGGYVDMNLPYPDCCERHLIKVNHTNSADVRTENVKENVVTSVGQSTLTNAHFKEL